MFIRNTITGVFALCYIFYTVKGCFQVPIAESAIKVCDTTAGITTCDYFSSFEYLFPIGVGSCMEIELQQGVFNGVDIIPEQPIRFKLELIDAYLANSVNSVYLTKTTSQKRSCICSCPGFTSTCASQGQCSTTNFCSSVFTHTPHGSFCFAGEPTGCAFSFLDTVGHYCGCNFELPDSGLYGVGEWGPYDLYARIRLTAGGHGSEAVYLLGFNQVNIRAGPYSIGLSLSLNNLPDPGVAGQGSLVYSFEQQNPYLMSGFNGLSTFDVTRYGWYQSLDGETWLYDQVAYQHSIAPISLVRCGDPVECSVHSLAARFKPLLIPQNELRNKLSPAYSFRLYSHSQSGSHVLFNIARPPTMNINVQTNAISVVSYVERPQIFIERAGSLSICEFGTKVMWVSGFNSGTVGYASLIYTTSSEEYNLGATLFPKGAYNVTTNLPIMLIGKVCVTSHIVTSCAEISPQCLSEVLVDPEYPSDGGINLPIEEVNDLIVLIIAILILVGAVMVICWCCRSR